MKPILIAPCGMNCNLCYAFLRKNNPCPGCRRYSNDKPDSRTKCFIKNCKTLKDNGWRHCSNKCKNYPCPKLKSLDKRYRIKYSVSMIENLGYIEKNGIKRFIVAQEQKWIKNNKIYCVHKKIYYELL